MTGRKGMLPVFFLPPLTLTGSELPLMSDENRWSPGTKKK